MNTLHELAGIFLIVIAIAMLMLGCNFAARTWRGSPWRAIVWDLFCAALLALFFFGIYHAL